MQHPYIDARVLKWVFKASGLETASEIDLLKEHRITASILNEIDSRIPFSAYLSLFEKVATFSRNPCLGLTMGMKAGAEAIGAVGYMFLRAETLHDALKLFEAGAPYIQDATRLMIKQEKTGVKVTYSVDDQMMKPRTQDAEFSIAVIYNLISTFLDRPLEPTYVTFEHQRQASLSHYESQFLSDVFFEQDENSIGISLQDLKSKNRRFDPYLIEILQSYLKLSGHNNLETSSLQKQVETLITSRLLNQNMVRIKTVSDQFGMSADTLNRRLKREGKTFREILLDCRMNISRRLLSDSDYNIVEIAQRIGYSDSAAFCRTFRKHVGMTPHSFRKRECKPMSKRNDYT